MKNNPIVHGYKELGEGSITPQTSLLKAQLQATNPGILSQGSTVPYGKGPSETLRNI